MPPQLAEVTGAPTDEAGPLNETTDAKETVACAICLSREFDVVLPARAADSTHDLASRFRSSGDEQLAEQLVACRGCGLQFVNPRLKSALVVDSYRAGTDEAFVSQARSREDTFARSLQTIEHHAGGRRGRILDVGTAGGACLKAAKDRGWDVDGCEPNRWLCEWARHSYGIDVRPGTIFEQGYPDEAFDAVSLWDVLEHTTDPPAVVDECARVMRPGGLLILTYPDIGSWAARVMGRSWVFLLSVHLYYFTRHTMTRLLNDRGFKVVLMKPHVQRLELGYVLHRAEPYVGRLARVGERGSRLLGIGGWSVPYWVGQTFVIAKKLETVPARSGQAMRTVLLWVGVSGSLEALAACL